MSLSNLYVILALLAFAGNSVLCKIALGKGLIDGVSFTGIRLVSGSLSLLLIHYGIELYKRIQKKNVKRTYSDTKKHNWLSPLYLFVYAISFSLAYQYLDTGVGALILFGMVQSTILIWNRVLGKQVHTFEYVEMLIAFLGVTYLLWPNSLSNSFGYFMSQNSLIGFALMALSGIAWGMYTVQGTQSVDPIKENTHHFVKTIPLVGLCIIVAYPTMYFSERGVVLAALSGVVTSALGYTIWYYALKKISSMTAAISQLLVPLIATMGGVFFMKEEVTMKWLLSSIMVLGGILLAIYWRVVQPHKERRKSQEL